MKKKYDLVVMLASDAKDEAKDKVLEKVEKTIKGLGGVVVKQLEMGKKQLAYKIKKQLEAVYVNLVLELPAAEVVQLDRKLTVDKDILRHLLVTA